MKFYFYLIHILRLSERIIKNKTKKQFLGFF